MRRTACLPRSFTAFYRKIAFSCDMGRTIDTGCATGDSAAPDATAPPVPQIFREIAKLHNVVAEYPHYQ